MDTDAVADSSVIVALVTPEKESEWATKKTREYKYLHLLDLSFYEVANAITYKVSSSFGGEDAKAAFKQAQKIMDLFAVHGFSEVLVEAFNSAPELKISIYDAAFLALSDRLNCKLVTLDVKLAKKLEKTKYAALIECP